MLKNELCCTTQNGLGRASSAVRHPHSDLLVALLVVWMLHDDCLNRLDGLLWLRPSNCEWRGRLADLCDVAAHGAPAGTILCVSEKHMMPQPGVCASDQSQQALHRSSSVQTVYAHMHRQSHLTDCAPCA